MEIIEVAGSVTVDCTALRVSHVASGLTRGLEPGEQLVLADEAGEFHAGAVRGIEFELEDTVYLVTVGARLPVELVEQRRRGPVAGSGESALHDLVDLLGELRGQTLPAAAEEERAPLLVHPHARRHDGHRMVSGL